MALVACSPSISGICMSMRTASKRADSSASTASRPLLATTTLCPSFSSMRCATRWLTGLSSASRIDSDAAPGAARRGTGTGAATGPASARCTQASSSGGLNGLLIRSTMPTDSATLASIGEPGVVIRMKRMPGARPSRRARSANSRPSMPGMW